MSKSFSGAGLFGMDAPTKRTHCKPEVAALYEVQKALRAHPAVVWCEHMSSGAARFGGRLMRFGFTGCPDVLGRLHDGRLLGVQVKAAKGTLRTEQDVMFEVIKKRPGYLPIGRMNYEYSRTNPIGKKCRRGCGWQTTEFTDSTDMADRG